jgi:hypothetical protein
MTTEPFDLDALIAERTAEAKPPFTFTFDGDTYEMPGVIDARIALDLSALSKNPDKLEGIFRRALGDEQWDRLVQSPVMMPGEVLGSLLDRWANYAAGINLGKSLRSASSSKSTAGPSKRTSRTTTKSA